MFLTVAVALFPVAIQRAIAESVTGVGEDLDAAIGAGIGHLLHEGQQIHRSGHWLIPDRWDEDTDCRSVDRLCAAFRGRKDVLIVPHIGGRRANLDFFDPELMPAIEIYSCHGVFEWFAQEALERGLVMGFLAGSDDHSGWRRR